jgi:hypothetical protein
MRKIGLLVCLIALGSTFAFAQDQEKKTEESPTAAAPAPPVANQADVASRDAIMNAVYEVISGPAGQKRDWNRFLSLFAPGARLIAVDKNKEGELVARVFTPDDYVKLASPYFDKEGFFERESSRTLESWANIEQIFSTYESRHAAGDAKPFARGINSFQLFNDGKRWWVVTIYWQEETPTTPLPKKYLGKKAH